MITADEIKKMARQTGFDLCGITTPEEVPEDAERYREWLEKGYHADMAWMAASQQRRIAPKSLMDTVQSIIMLGVNYYQPDSEQIPAGRGRVSRYARGRDYHKLIARMIKTFLVRIEKAMDRDAVVQEKDSVRFKWWVDYGPFLERAYARKAGMGFVGKNSMLINKDFGSWFFLAEIVTTLELEPDTVPDNFHGSCGRCTRCIEACPTGAIVEDGLIDSKRCLSYLTIEHKGAIGKDLAEAAGDILFGCDICQEVCPYNIKRAVPTKHKQLLPEYGVGEYVDCEKILSLESDEQFLKLTAGTPLTRPKLYGLKRNAEIVLENAEQDNME